MRAPSRATGAGCRARPGRGRGDHLLLEQVVQPVRMAGVLRRGILVLRAAVDLPAVAAVVALDPPAVEHAQVEPAVRRRLHAARPARLERRAGDVDPDVAAADDRPRDREVVVLEEGHPGRDPDRLREREDVHEHLLRVVVERMRLAGDDHLERRAVGEDPADALGVVGEQEEALVRRDAPCEAERQRVLGERLGDRPHRLGVLAAEQAVVHRLRLDVVDEEPARLVPRGPELGVGNPVDGAHVAGSAARSSHPSPRWSSRRRRIGGERKLGRWTPFVTWVIGTSSAGGSP